MMYPYVAFDDGVEVVHSHLIDNEKVVVHFEQPVDGGFRSARCELPGYHWTENDGFSDEKIQEFVQFLKSNAHLLFRFAQNGGISCA